MRITGLYAALATLLILVLAVRVIAYRRSHKIGLGDGDDIELRKRIRAHGNAIEYLVLGLLLLLLLELNQTVPLLLHRFRLVLILARPAQPWGVPRPGGVCGSPCVGFGCCARVAGPRVVLVYMLVCVGCVRYYLTTRRKDFNPFLHLVAPIGGIVLFFFPLYYQFYKVPPPYPFKYANWVAIGYTVIGIAVTVAVVWLRPNRLQDLDRVYVEDETMTPHDDADAFPVA